jgi:molecular chaperone HtpG
MDGQLDPAMVGLFEQKFEKCRFTRVDSDIVDKLIVKNDEKKEELAERDKKILSKAFEGSLPKLNKIEFMVDSQALGESASPVVITQSEYMRRMKDMARLQPGMAFYGEMPDMMNLVLNTDHPLIKKVLTEAQAVAEDIEIPAPEPKEGEKKEEPKKDIKVELKDTKVVSQLIDLALLQNGMLKGEALSNFVKRSVELI